jgi:hypothetical protein
MVYLLIMYEVFNSDPSSAQTIYFGMTELRIHEEEIVVIAKALPRNLNV